MNKEEIDNIVRRKDLDKNFTQETNDIIDNISFFNGKDVELLGSMAIRSMWFASDYDLFQVVQLKSIEEGVNELKKMIRNITDKNNYYLGDIKIGEVNEWELIDEYLEYEDYDVNKIQERLDKLKKEGILTTEEIAEAEVKLLTNPTEAQFEKIKKDLRFHILRWNANEIIQGYKTFRTKKITLEEAMKSRGLFKLDCIVRLENGLFQEFSIIYDLRMSNMRIGLKPMDTLKTLEKEIQLKKLNGEWFKVLKRLFSYWSYIYKYKKDDKREAEKELKSLHKVLNSDLGILYQVKGDLDVLSFLIENNRFISIKKVKYEVDGFKERLANVYNTNSYLKREPTLLSDINKILKLSSKEDINNKLEKIENTIQSLLNKETRKKITQYNINIL